MPGALASRPTWCYDSISGSRGTQRDGLEARHGAKAVLEFDYGVVEAGEASWKGGGPVSSGSSRGGRS